MAKIRVFLTSAIVLAALALCAVFAADAVWQMAVLSIVWGAGWFASLSGKRGWVSSLALVFYLLGILIGFHAGLSIGWMLGGLVAALSAWELDGFYRRLLWAQKVENLDRFVSSHLWRLFWVDLAGLGLGLFALSLHLKLAVGWMILLVFLAALGLAQLTAYLRKVR